MYINSDKRRLQALIREDERYAAIAASAAEITKSLIAGFRDQPNWISGWGHAFVCPDCAAQMHYDPELAYRPGQSFVCPACGKAASGRALDEAWVYYYRITYAEKLEAAAVCALLGDHDAFDFLTRYFDFYADTYEGFAPHMGDDCRPKEPSKLMPQLLDEAVWCTYVLRALYPCRALFPEETLARWRDRLFRPLVDVITEPRENNFIHNHVLWHMAAAGMAALTFGDDSLNFAIDGEFGIRRQVKEGFTDEGFWFECSQLYHYYALEALTGFCQLLADKNPADPLLSVLESAYTVPMLTSYDGWHIPSMNDGWYPLTLARFAGQLHRAAMATGSRVLADQLTEIKRREPALLDHPCALLLEPVPAKTALIPGAKMAIIQSPVFAVLKSGVIATSHRHQDCLGVNMPPVSDDLGTPGYAHELYRSWYVTPASHNTIAVNGKQPGNVIPTHVEAGDASIGAVIDGGWEGVTASRTLTADGDALRDMTEVTLEKAGCVDWFFHFDGNTEISAEIGGEASLGEGAGYAHFRDVRRISGESVTVRAQKDGETLVLTAALANTEAFLAKSPGNPSGVMRTTLILRQRGTSAVFDVKFTK